MESASRIITISGRPGSGKTTVVKRLLIEKPEWQLVTSVTTREFRQSDLPGEYDYVSREEFRRRGREREFIWTVSVHGQWYGTPYTAINDALRAETHRLMILTPDRLYVLHKHGFDQVVSFYLQSPSDEELYRRMVERGEPSTTAQARIEETKGWDRDIQQIAQTISSVYFILPASPADIEREFIERVSSLADCRS